MNMKYESDARTSQKVIIVPTVLPSVRRLLERGELHVDLLKQYLWKSPRPSWAAFSQS
jgi:hypothetical protein